MGEHEIDVRTLPKPDKHPAIFRAYAGVPVGESLLLVNDHDPRHLRDEFEIEFPGGYSWEYIARDPRDWRIRITKLASTPLPRVLADTAALDAPDAAGAGGAGGMGGAGGTGGAGGAGGRELPGSCRCVSATSTPT